MWGLHYCWCCSDYSSTNLGKKVFLYIWYLVLEPFFVLFVLQLGQDIELTLSFRQHTNPQSPGGLIRGAAKNPAAEPGGPSAAWICSHSVWLCGGECQGQKSVRVTGWHGRLGASAGELRRPWVGSNHQPCSWQPNALTFTTSKQRWILRLRSILVAVWPF